MDKTRYLIIGAGVSGLAFAEHLRSPEYLVCEAADAPGGYCRTVKQDGFTWDYSGHFFHFRNKDIERYLVARMGDQRVLTVEKKARILYKEQWVDFPFQKNIHQLPREDFLDCLVDLYFRDDGPASNFYEMLYAKFGRSIAENFLIPYNEKLYATDLRRLDADAMGRFFPHARVEEIIRNFRQPDNRSYNATFTYPEGGAEQYVNALLQGVDAQRVLLNEPIEAIDLKAKHARTPHRVIGFDYLISSMPFARLLEMTGVPHDPLLYACNKVEVFNLGFDKKGPSDVHWIYVPERQYCFYRVGFYDNIFGGDRMSLYVEIGHPSLAELPPPDQQLQRVLSDLHASGLLSEQKLVSHHHVILDPAYVHITKESAAEVARQKQILATRGVYSIGRYGSWTYCSIEDNILEARALAQTFNALG